MNNFIKGWILTLLLGGFAATTFGQNTSTGEIRGTVTDTSNAVISKATVLLTNTDTGETKQFVTNKDGLYDTVSTPRATTSLFSPCKDLTSCNVDLSLSRSIRSL
jgi:hypothetical protein